ncbi:MAG: hypothetical protein ACTSWW_09130 [Promethearchaeota archaeon]
MLNHVILNTFGFTGSWKSGLNIEIGRLMDETFSAEKIAFSDNEFLGLVKKAHPKDFVLRDEITKEYGIGSGRQNAFIVMQTETLRANQVSMGFVSPTLKPIDTAHYILHSIGHNDFAVDDENNPIEPIFVLAGVQNPMTQNYLGGIVVEIEWMNKVWKQYWEKKKDFLDNVRKRHFSKANFFEMAGKVIENPKAEFVKTKYEWMVLIQTEFPDLTTEEVKMLYATIKLQKRMDE